MKWCKNSIKIWKCCKNPVRFHFFFVKFCYYLKVWNFELTNWKNVTAFVVGTNSKIKHSYWQRTKLDWLQTHPDLRVNKANPVKATDTINAHPILGFLDWLSKPFVDLFMSSDVPVDSSTVVCLPSMIFHFKHSGITLYCYDFSLLLNYLLHNLAQYMYVLTVSYV